ncbi:MAG: hypothetical protein IKX40_04725 [Thermoguttaceae bacterium]|nr:hypothetical protein [Thermoguttaceae bacterium]
MTNSAIKKTIKKINKLENELKQQGSLLGEQMMDYAQWAGRLCSLGIKKHLNRFFERFGSDPKFINDLLKKRINEGLTDINESFGEYLAVEIFTVQDFCCFVNHAPKGFINSETEAILDFWIQMAESQILDKETAHTLKVYLDCYPIAKGDRLDIIAAPWTESELMSWEAILDPMDKVIKQKSKILKEQIHIKKVDWFSEYGQISIRISGVNPEDVERVRQRFVPAIRSKKDPSIWTFDFEVFGSRFNEQNSIVVQMYDGSNAKVLIESDRPFAN